MIMSVLLAGCLGAATVRLPVSPCFVTNTPAPKACEPGCCGNKTCCATSHERTGPPVQPLAKSTIDQVSFVAVAVMIAAPFTLAVTSEPKVVFFAEPTAHSPPRLPLLCTFLI